MSNYANGLPARRVRPRSRLSGQTPLGPLIFLINSLQGCGGRNSPTSAGETGGRQGASPQDWPSEPPAPSSKAMSWLHPEPLPSDPSKEWSLVPHLWFYLHSQEKF